MFSSCLIRLRALFRRDTVEAEFDEELRYHYDREVERLVARGVSEQDAHLAARRVLGDSLAIKQEARETWRWRRVDELVQDTAYAVRVLR